MFIDKIDYLKFYFIEIIKLKFKKMRLLHCISEKNTKIKKKNISNFNYIISTKQYKIKLVILHIIFTNNF